MSPAPPPPNSLILAVLTDLPLPCLPALQPGRGDLWVTYSIAFPKSISDEQRQQLKALFGANPEWQRRQLAHDEL